MASLNEQSGEQIKNRETVYFSGIKWFFGSQKHKRLMDEDNN